MDVYHDYSHHSIFTDGFTLSIYHNIWEYWATHKQANFTDIALKTQSLLAIQFNAATPSNTSNQNRILEILLKIWL